MKKIASILLCTVMLTSAAGYAAAEGSDNLISTDIINPGEVTTIDITPRLKSNVVAKVGDKTVIYGVAHNSGGLYAYDITDGKTAVQLGSTIAVTAYDNKEAEMYVKDGYLIFGNGNDVQINKLNDDGSVGDKAFSKTVGVVTDLDLADGLLFASSENKNNGVTVYDISDPSNAQYLGNITTDDTVRNSAVEKLENGGYRVYMLTKATVDSISTLKFSVADVTYDAGTFSATMVSVAALPKYDGYGWPGYNGYATPSSGGAVLLKNGYVGVESLNSGRYTVDVTNVAEPTVINAETISSTGYCFRRLRLDDTKVIDIPKNGTGINIMDYTIPDKPKQIAAIAGIKGEGASIIDNYLYTTVGGKINKVKLYDEYTVHTPIVERNDGSIDVSVDVDNHVSQSKTMALVAVIYNNGKMIDMKLLSDTVPANEKNYNFSVNLDVSGVSEYTFKTWMFDNFADMILLTDVVD